MKKRYWDFYISGHPLEEYEEQWKRGISHVTTDFLPPEEGELPKVHDGERATVGGMITTKTMKATKTNKMMAFITIEDLVGTVEVIVFPRDYEKIGKMLNVDDKVFVSGRISAEGRSCQQDDPGKHPPVFRAEEGTVVQFTDGGRV